MTDAKTRGRAVPVFLCGERMRGDDAVAFAVGAALSDGVGEPVRIVEAGVLDVDALLALDDDCVVVDAVVGPAPGTPVVLPLEQLAAGGHGAFGFASATSTHALSIPSTLALAALLRGRPVRGHFVGVGIASCAFAAPLSPDVAAAVPALASTVVRIARELRPAEAVAC